MAKLTADLVKAALDKAAGDEKAMWPILTGVIVNLTERLDALEDGHGKLFKGTVQLAKESKGIREFLEPLKVAMQNAANGGGDGGGEVEPGSEGDVAAVTDAVPSGGRMGADGLPITNQSQLDAEAAMDAATGVQPPAPPAPPQRQPQRRNGGGGRGRAPAPAAAPAARTGADGQPIVDPDQLAAEAAMDAALEG